jgi:pimeloyl-ACP methyl ester carboxylesterase
MDTSNHLISANYTIIVPDERIGTLSRESFETSDGVILSYEDRGSGRPIVFVHGWAATKRFWEGQTRRLSSNFRIIALDLRGHGESYKDADLDYSAGRMIKDILELMNTLGIRKPLLVGHSLGGVLAAHCAIEIGASGLVITGVSQKNQAPLLRLRILMKMRWLAEKVVTPRMFAPGTDEKLLDFVRNESAKSPAGVLVEVMKQTTGSVLPSFQEHREIPLLVIAGEFDSIVPIVSQKKMSEELGGAFKMIEGAGHNLMLEKPDEFALLIEEFSRTMDI